ncbi:hypothetical protein F5883DRAFT_6603 [Diaporthe sp. PMI_573]|nr:hypothetical protein F5883DRAFT_6603 [Diaporthaceae sp. PMI_573]
MNRRLHRRDRHPRAPSSCWARNLCLNLNPYVSSPRAVTDLCFSTVPSHSNSNILTTIQSKGSSCLLPPAVQQRPQRCMRGQQKWGSNRPTPLPIIPERQKPPILSLPLQHPLPCPDRPSCLSSLLPLLDLPANSRTHSLPLHAPLRPWQTIQTSILPADLILSELGTGPQFRVSFHRFTPRPCLVHLHFSTDSRYDSGATAGHFWSANHPIT